MSAQMLAAASKDVLVSTGTEASSRVHDILIPVVVFNAPMSYTAHRPL